VPIRLTTPFGRRSLTLAHTATQTAEANRPPDKVAHKTQVSRAISTARPTLSVLEPVPAVLNALLSFFPRAKLTGEDSLIVRAGRGIKLALGFDLVSQMLRREEFQRLAESIEGRGQSDRAGEGADQPFAGARSLRWSPQAKRRPRPISSSSPWRALVPPTKKFSRPHTCSRRAAPTVEVALTAGGR
jgi:Replication protein C N-terminal domain